MLQYPALCTRGAQTDNSHPSLHPGPPERFTKASFTKFKNQFLKNSTFHWQELDTSKMKSYSESLELNSLVCRLHTFKEHKDVNLGYILRHQSIIPYFKDYKKSHFIERWKTMEDCTKLYSKEKRESNNKLLFKQPTSRKKLQFKLSNLFDMAYISICMRLNQRHMPFW